MKKFLTLGLLLLSLAVFAGRSLAYDNYHDDKHWYGKDNKPHTFVMHHHHHGYWDTNSGSKVFINID